MTRTQAGTPSANTTRIPDRTPALGHFEADHDPVPRRAAQARVLGRRPCARRQSIHIPSIQMVWRSAPVTKPSPYKMPDSEKITINLGFVDLGQIELLVREGFYSNRSDFIRTAIRNQIERHAETVRQIVVRKSVELGLRHITRDELSQAQAAGQMLDFRVLGLAVIAPDVTAELARDTVSALSVLGTLVASDDVKAALADRIT